MAHLNLPAILRRFLFSSCLTVAGGWVFAACSSDTPRQRPTGTGDDTTGGAGGSGGTGVTTGLLTGSGSGTAGAIGTGVGGGGGAGGSSDPPLTDCSATKPCPGNQICVTTPMGGKCSPNGGPCDPMADMCQNDMYCCAGTCRIPESSDGVCVVGGTRPTDNKCNTKIAVGVFQPDLQCEWKEPPNGDPYPKHKQVLATPLVADLPNDSGTAAEIIIVTSDSTTGGRAGDGTGGRIRILNGQSCAQVEVIKAGPAVRDGATPAIGDLDGDGVPEIVTRVNFPKNDTLIAFTWKTNHYDVLWQSQPDGIAAGVDAWDGVSLHDLNNDGLPEIIGRAGEVFNGKTGARITAGGGTIFLKADPAVGDVDHDGAVDLVANKVFSWDTASNSWKEKYPGVNTQAAFFAFADFGTRSGPGAFDPKTKDGIAEVVAVGAINDDSNTGTVRIATLQGEMLMQIDHPRKSSPCSTGQEVGERGGPPTIGDFDGDGMPELATAGAYAYRVYDLECTGPSADCKEKNIRWAQDSQDCSSGMTGSTIFDFEGDGRAEAVYADECFVRVYDGKTGEVLFSTYRSSATWWDQPIVADPDHSDRSKIIFSGSSNAQIFGFCAKETAEPRKPADTVDTGKNGFVDKIYKGLRCLAPADCPSGVCDAGFCRCTGTNDAECGNTWVRDPNDTRNEDAENGLVCTTPIPGTPGTGNVCRMQHANITTIPKADFYFTGIKVFRDKRDRWASSRALWNQHAYDITNVNDNGTIPKTSDWLQNYAQPKLNNFRQNRQGATSADLADITGAVDPADACRLTKDGGIEFKGRICNRGLRGVAFNMPATFYLGGGDAGPIGAPICQTTTLEPVPVGACKDVTCVTPKASVPDGSTITMIVNDSGGGMRIVDECNYNNNTATSKIGFCMPPK